MEPAAAEPCAGFQIPLCAFAFPTAPLNAISASKCDSDRKESKTLIGFKEHLYARHFVCIISLTLCYLTNNDSVLLDLIVHILYQRDLSNITQTIKLEPEFTSGLSNYKSCIAHNLRQYYFSNTRNPPPGLASKEFIPFTMWPQSSLIRSPSCSTHGLLAFQTLQSLSGSSQMTPNGMGRAAAPVPGTGKPHQRRRQFLL